MGQFLLDIQSLGERLFNRLPEHAEVSHFTAGATFHFSVKVKLGAGVAQNGPPVGLQAAAPQVAEQIYHHS